MAVQILEESLGKIVLIKLRGGKSIRGLLKGYDQHLNLVLDKAEDVTDSENVKELGLIIVWEENGKDGSYTLQAMRQEGIPCQEEEMRGMRLRGFNENQKVFLAD